MTHLIPYLSLAFRSLLNTKCRICRRKTDPENMLLCDGCDRGHHMYCLKPKLKAVPKGDWFCSDCKPKERMRSPKKKARRAFSAEDDEDVDQVRSRLPRFNSFSEWQGDDSGLQL